MDATTMVAYAAWINTGLLMLALFFAFVRTTGLEKNRKLQVALTIFQELQAQGPIDTRKYIYNTFPESIEGLENDVIKAHIQKAEVAFLVFDRIGYLVIKKHIDKTDVMENYWSSIWRCWQKSKNAIEWARQRRGQKDYFEKFEQLFHLSEAHRLQNEYEEPKFY